LKEEEEEEEEEERDEREEDKGKENKERKYENMKSLSVVLRHLMTFESLVACTFLVPSLAKAIDVRKLTSYWRGGVLHM
jgi:hypothetical protein